MSLIEPQSSPTAILFEAARPPPPHELDLAARVEIVAEVAAAHAEATDTDVAFPAAAIEAAKAHGLLGLAVPVELGGEGATVSALADIAYVLGQACASTAMIFAMHHSALACVIRHADGSAWHRELLRRVAAENLLLASSTTEGLAGGDVRSSAAPLVPEGGHIALERAATVVSYGAQADGIVTTARRDAEGSANDQALVVFLKEDYTLTPTGGWQTLGMRGTCSQGFALKASAPAAQILPLGYTQIHPQTMVPVSHLLWASAWAGIAAAAVQRAQTFTRTAARRAGGKMPPGAPQCTRAIAALQSLRDRLAGALARYEAIRDEPARLGALETQAALNLLKVEASEQALDIVMTAMRACGLAGYRNDGDFAIGRQLRDILSAPIMVHNDRILSNIAATALMGAIPMSLGH